MDAKEIAEDIIHTHATDCDWGDVVILARDHLDLQAKVDDLEIILKVRGRHLKRAEAAEKQVGELRQALIWVRNNNGQDSQEIFDVADKALTNTKQGE